MNKGILNYMIARWKDSAADSFASNEKEARKNGWFYFQITSEQKEYLEHHLDEVKKWIEDWFGATPTEIVFEPFDGEYTCDCKIK